MGTSDSTTEANLEYPLAFAEQMSRVLETRAGRPLFRFIYLSGIFVRQDQEQKLWLLEKPRKTKVWFNQPMRCSPAGLIKYI